MHPAAEFYLDEVLRHARLAPVDAREVREELADHIASLPLFLDSTGPHTSKEVFDMIEEKLGAPESLGEDIGRSRGRVRTFLEKQKRRAPLALAVAVLAVVLLRWQVASAFNVAGHSMDPVLPEKSWVLVNKLASPAVGDIVVFWNDTQYIVAHVDRVNEDGTVHVSKASDDPVATAGYPRDIPGDSIIGRVSFIWR